MKCYWILAAVLPAIELVADKPVVDWYGDLAHGLHYLSYYERPHFILANADRLKEKKSDIALVSELAIDNIDSIRAKGYKKIIGYLYERGEWRWPGVKTEEDLNAALKAWAEVNLEKYDLILTHKQYLLEHYPEKCKWLHALGYGTLREHAIHPKTQLCSHMVSENKTLEGHKLRWAVAEKYDAYFDVCKTGETPFIEWKDSLLNDFCFSVVIENVRESHYFSEKLVECLRAGTVPIYWGCPTLGEFFDMEGIIPFNSLEDLEPILKSLSMQEYTKRLPAIRRNFELAGRYPQYGLAPLRRNNMQVDSEDPWKYDIDRPDVFDCVWPYIEPYFWSPT